MARIHLRNLKLGEFLRLAFSFKQALRFVWEGGPHWLFLNGGVLLIQGLLPIVSIYMLKLVVDALNAALAAPDRERAFQPVIWFILLAGGIALFGDVAAKIGELVTKLQAWAVFDHMSDVLQRKGIEVDLEFFENAQYQDTLHRAQREASYRPMTVLQGLVQIVQSSISLLGIGFLLLSLHWTVLPVLLVGVAPGIVARMVFSNMQYRFERKYTSAERRSWYYYWIIGSLDFAKEVRIFELGETIRKRYQDIRQVIRQARARLEKKNVVMGTLAQVVSTLTVYGLYGYIAYRTVQGQQTLGDLVMYFQAFQRSQGFLQGMLGGVARIYESNLFLTNLYEFLKLEKKVVEPANPVPLPDPMQEGIEFEQVSFTYPNTTHQVLHNINIQIRPGEVIALVGENGSGKTTLIKLLCRLYDPTGGRIKIDGRDLTQYHTEDLRRAIGVIFQDYARYNLTVQDNIWFGNVAQTPEDGLISAAARKADAHQMIVELPAGYQTVLGKMFENGEELSIGQWQKIALARAFYKNSQVIILDEPTSALDPQAEYEVFAKFRELLGGRTAVLISHRMSTVRMADRIYVIRDGCVAESGTHEELMNKAGIYARLFEQQAQNYR